MFRRFSLCQEALKRLSSNSPTGYLSIGNRRLNATTAATPPTGGASSATQERVKKLEILAGEDTKYVVGNEYTGWNCMLSETIPEFNMKAYLFKHELGCEYLHLDRQDSNNVFSINFRTTPTNSTGLPHILEHVTLCGSDRFPVRDPFFKMLNRSVATFMNAMTGPDYTMYPFSSMNETDFRHLQMVYLDAVFNPNLKYLDFLQEGWRLELNDLNDKSSGYTIKGVVFNEMKGSFSDNNTLFWQKFFNTMLPDTTYGYVSGGDPLIIPTLTHKDLVDFHHKYYHPSNAKFFSYGNFRLDNTLEYINSEYLTKPQKINTNFSLVTQQPRWTDPKTVEISSRFDTMGAPIEKQNQIAIGYLMADALNLYDTFVLQVLSELLIKGPNSIFYKRLIEPNISGGYNRTTGYDSQTRDTMFTIGLQDLEKSNFNTFLSIFDETIDEIVKKGFEKDHVESVLHNMELNVKHLSPRFGLGLLINLTPLWNHNADIIEALRIQSMINRFRNDLKNEGFLQDKVQQYFRNNTHKLTMTMIPDLEYEKKFNAAEQDLLKSKIDAITSEMAEQIYKDGLSLAADQKKQDDLSVLPCLKLENVVRPPEPYMLNETKIQNTNVNIVTIDTNGVTYFKGVLNAQDLTDEAKLLIPILAEVMDQMGTKKYDYRSLDKYIQSKTSGVFFNPNFAENHCDLNLYELGMFIESYCLDKNTEDMFNIIGEIANNFEFSDANRFKMLLDNYISNIGNGIANNGHFFAMQSSAGLLTQAAKTKATLLGVEHIYYMKELQKHNTPEQILQKLAVIAESLFDRNILRCGINVAQKQHEPAIKNLDWFLDQMPVSDGENLANSFCTSTELKPSCMHHVMNIPVNYCAKSIIGVPYCSDEFAPLRVLSKFLTAKYLLPVLREQNGAYGAGCRMGTDGMFSFFSYRDPNSRKSLDLFDESSNWLKSNEKLLTDEALFEAKLSVLQQIDAPLAPGNKGVEHLRYGVTQEAYHKHRESILAVTKEQLLLVANKFLGPDSKQASAKSVLGPANETLKKDSETWNTTIQD